MAGRRTAHIAGRRTAHLAGSRAAHMAGRRTVHMAGRRNAHMAGRRTVHMAGSRAANFRRLVANKGKSSLKRAAIALLKKMPPDGSPPFPQMRKLTGDSDRETTDVRC
jgi:hypothetical protein